MEPFNLVCKTTEWTPTFLTRFYCRLCERRSDFCYRFSFKGRFRKVRILFCWIYTYFLVIRRSHCNCRIMATSQVIVTQIWGYIKRAIVCKQFANYLNSICCFQTASQWPRGPHATRRERIRPRDSSHFYKINLFYNGQSNENQCIKK